ncbi:MAG: PorV/PorQ family protein [Bacteroidota bacterium]
MKTFIAFFILTTSYALPQNVNTGLPFLKTGTDARSSAMGEAFTSVTNDHSSFFYNPASIHFSDRRQLLLSHRQGFADVATDYLGTTLPGETITVGISALTTSVSNIEIRQRPGESEGTFNARNAALSAGVAFAPMNDLAVGVSGKLLYEKIYIDEASGYAFDAGMMYSITKEIRAGISILNIGTMGVLRSESSPLPSTLRLGGSYGTNISTDVSLFGSADVVKTLDDDGTHFHCGGELSYQSLLMVRAGYQSGYETKSFSTGLGVQYGIIRFDYAFVPMSGTFSPNHTFSLVFFL